MKDKSEVRDGVIFEHQDSHAEPSHFYEEDTNVLDGVSLKRCNILSRRQTTRLGSL